MKFFSRLSRRPQLPPLSPDRQIVYLHELPAPVRDHLRKLADKYRR